MAETITPLKKLAVFSSVWLVEVLGHSGVSGNEEAADKLARQASLILYTGTETVLGASSTTVQIALNQWSIWKQWKWSVPRPTQCGYQDMHCAMRIVVGLLTGHPA